MKSYLIYLVAAIVVGISAVLIYNNFIASKGNTVTSSKQTTAETNAPVVVENPVYKNTLTLTKFSPGSTVSVESANLSTAGFIVVHEDKDNQPGVVIGNSQLLTAGSHSSIDISLTRPIVTDETIYVMIHTDNGDGTFNATTDRVANDNQGNPAIIDFRVGLE